MEDSNNFQAGWNLAEPMLFDIANRLRGARDYLLAGRIEKYYWTLETILRMIYGFLTDEERKLARTKEEEIQKLLPMEMNNSPKLNALAKDYDGFLMILLHNHKLLVPPKKDRTRLIA